MVKLVTSEGLILAMIIQDLVNQDIGDTHIRVEGDVIDALQIRFILDWNSQAHRPQFEYDDKYFPKKTA